MRYTVVWVPAALDALARIWTQASDQAAVSAAANQIDQWLKFSPTTVGMAYGTRRRLVVAPLAVVYRLYPDDCLVRLIKVDYVI